MQEPRAVCLSVSKRNQPILDMLDEYSVEFNLPVAGTIFRIVKEYDQMKKWNYYSRALEKTE
jgi:hypothetical protein